MYCCCSPQLSTDACEDGAPTSEYGPNRRMQKNYFDIPPTSSHFLVTHHVSSTITLTMSDRVRLHITPFNPDLLDRFIPAAIKPVATNLSFHTIETFPERGFGYVELPVTEAQKLKNKFNGMTLKGTKVKIEEAKKEKKRKVEVEDEDVEVKKPSKKAKKSKKGEGVLEGHELAEGRIVKRGWTEETAKKSKDGKVKKEEKKMKFKTLVPPNAVPLEDEAGAKKEKKDKKEKKERTEEEKAERAAKKAQKKEALVKEFANTTKLNFPNSAGDKKQKHYEEGVGWVDQDGNVVEPEPSSEKRKREKREKKERKAAEKKAAEKIPTPEPESESEVEEAASEESKSESEEDVEMEEAQAVPASKVDTSSEDEKAASPAESDSDSENDSLDEHLNQAENNTVSNGATSQSRQATPTPVGEVVEEVDELDAEVAKEVHPLEALYKRSDSKPAPIDTSFNFFAAGGDDDDDDPIVEQQILIPQTPHTQEDFEWRSTRSAAPTPDTAAIGKKFNFPPTAVTEENDDEDDDDDDEVEKELGDGKGEESEFRKWFYANRGDLNRGWKKRRKEERKLVRQRENRRASRRIA